VAEDRLAAAAKRAEKPGVATYGDWQKLLANADVNAVVIATPNLLAPEMLLAAIQAGKHVLCEKPAGISPAEAEEMRRAADAAKTVVMFGMQYRHNPKQRKVRELIDAGPHRRAAVHRAELLARRLEPQPQRLAPTPTPSSPTASRATGGSPTPPRAGRSTSSPATTSTCSTGSPGHLPTAVAGDGGIAVYHDGRDTWDHASVTLTYPGGVRAVHTLSLFGPGRADVTVMGEEGSIEMVGDAFRLTQSKRRGVAGAAAAAAAAASARRTSSSSRRRKPAARPTRRARAVRRLRRVREDRQEARRRRRPRRGGLAHVLARRTRRRRSGPR
jgi:predicted dehydrogenase